MHNWSFFLFFQTETIPTAEPAMNIEVGSINYQLNQINF